MPNLTRLFRALFQRRRFREDLNAEIREHLERATEQYVARGMSLADARLAARRDFGNVTVLQEEARDAQGARWIDEIVGDARFAIRYFGRHKATTAIIVAVLALSAGANTFIFSMFQAYFLRPAPAVARNASLVRVWSQERRTATSDWDLRGFTGPELAALASHTEIFRDVAAWTEDEVVLDGGDGSGVRGLNAQFVTPNYFGVLGVPVVAGRAFRQAEGDAPDMTAVMGYGMAEQLFGSARAAIGRQIRVNEMPVVIIGVTPPRFQGALRNMDDAALWMPMSARANVDHTTQRWMKDAAVIAIFGRLAPGASVEQATAVARHVVAAALPDSASRVGLARTAVALGMQALPPGRDSHEMALGLAMILVIGVLILLVAWMNVSSLMVAAAVGRRHEIAVRLSLGASRARLLRQLVTESTVLAVVGSSIGLVLAWWVMAWRATVEIHGVDLSPDALTFTFVGAMAVGAGVLFGLSPALHATRGGVASALRDSGTATSGRSRLQRGFVVAQIALSQPLLVFLGTMLSLVLADYRPLEPEMSRHVISARFHAVRTGAAAQRPEAVDSLIPRLAARPGVVNAVPQPSGFDVRRVVAPGAGPLPADSMPTIVNLEGTAPGWFSMVDVPIMLGRDVSLADTASRDMPVVIGSDLARILWGSENPVGRVLPSPGLRELKQDSMTMIVVGVYDASRRLPGMQWGGTDVGGSIQKTVRHVYTAYGKHWEHDQVLIRTRGPAAPLVRDVQEYLRAAAPTLPVRSVQTLAQIDESQYAVTLQSTAFAAAGGALALLLASLGLYGVVSLAVRQRTREIGIRIALGARPVSVARMFLASGVRASVIALIIGLPLSIIGLKIGLTQGLLIAPGVNPYLIGGAIALILVAVASAATWVPARRAAKVDPARTLRVE